MPWFKVDDKLHDHRKVRLAGLPAMGLWIVAGTWSADNLTGGFVPVVVLARWGTHGRQLAGRLVDAGLWVPGENQGEAGWWFHDWLAHQPNPDDVREKRSRVSEVRSVAGRKGAANRWHPDSKPDGKPIANEWQADGPDPTRPDPTRKTPPSTDVDKRTDPTYRFDDFWLSYPQRKGRRVGRTKALERWKRLSYDDKAAAFRGVSHYRIDCDADRTIAKDADRWLRDRCWEDWQDEADPVRAMGKQDRRLIDSGLVDAYLEACNPNGQPAITTGATT